MSKVRIEAVEAAALRGRPLHAFDFVMAAFIAVLPTPVTYAVVGWLQRREGVDVYDEGTNFTPFRARV